MSILPFHDFFRCYTFLNKFSPNISFHSGNCKTHIFISEMPLIIYKTKFDIRQWFLITSVQPLTVWIYRESYLRFSSQIFSLDNFHESLHLTNHAVQCKYNNVTQRDKALPDDNMWDCHTFQAYLKQIGMPNKWEEVIYPGNSFSIFPFYLPGDHS